MALQKAFTNDQGHIGDYWRIDQITMERKGMKMEVRFNLYKSKVDRDGGKRAMNIQKVIVFNIPPLGATLSQMIAGIYNQAKTTITSDQQPDDVPFFDGAANV